MTARLFRTEPEDAGQRLDVWLAGLLPETSRSYLQKLIKDECILVDGKPAKGSLRLRGEEEISVDLPDPTPLEVLPEDLPLDILYEDDDLIFVNKPKGMVVHPGAGHRTGTVVNGLMAHCGGSLSAINGVLRPGIVHRIDKDTSGVIVVCKNDAAHRAVAEQLAAHSANRVYHTIVCGRIREDGTVSAPIARARNNRLKMAVDPAGKRAVTHYTVMEEFSAPYTYLCCRLETGRTHQIRVHMDSIGHPVLGDTVYGNRPSPFRTEGQTLHAGLLGLIHPRTGAYLEVEAPLPAYFTELLRKLRDGAG